MAKTKKQNSKSTKQEAKCQYCDGEQGELAFFHSKCCSAHFEGVIDCAGYLTIACENCGKYCGTLDAKPIINIPVIKIKPKTKTKANANANKKKNKK